MAVTYTLAPNIFQQWFDDDGNPANGYQIFTYATGTSTKLATYTDSTGLVAQTNPIILDSAGRPPSPLYFQPLPYKVVLALPEDTDPPTSPLQTVDPAGGIPAQGQNVEVPGISGEALTVNDLVYLSAGDGGRTAGRWYKTDADLDYASLEARVLGFAMNTVSTGALDITVRIGGQMTGLSGLTAGSLYYASATAGALTATAPQNPRKIGQADSTTTLVIRVDLPAEPYRLMYAARTGTATVGAGETTLATITLPANTLQLGDTIRFRWYGLAANTVNAKTLSVYVGGVTFALVTASVALVNAGVMIQGDALVVSSGSVRLNANFTSNQNVIPDSIGTAVGAVTLTGTVEVKITGTGVANGDLSDNGFVVSVERIVAA
jgi:hypothetical protein